MDDNNTVYHYSSGASYQFESRSLFYDNLDTHATGTYTTYGAAYTDPQGYGSHSYGHS